MSDEWLRKNLRAAGKAKGECPGTESLAKFLGGELTAEDSARIISHAASCGVCDALLERMKRFDDPVAWEDADRRIAPRFGRFPGGPDSFGLSVLRRPWFAYAVVALLIYPAYRGLVPKQVAKEPPLAQPVRPVGLDSAKVLQLDATRSAGTNGIVLTGKDKVFILSFFVPIRAGQRYSAEIVNQERRVVVAQPEISSHDGLGNFYLVCEHGLFERGRYVLTVKEAGGARYDFRFTL